LAACVLFISHRAPAQPVIVSTVPTNLVTGVCPTAPVWFTFSEPMDPAAAISEEVQGTTPRNLQAGLATPYPLSTNRFPIVSASWADYVNKCSMTLDPGQSSTWAYSLGLQLCANPPLAVFILIGPYPPLETWTGCSSASMPGAEAGAMFDAAIECQGTQNGGGGLFTFPLPDGEAEIINEAISGSNESGPCADPLNQATATVQILIEHTPQ
jgi:hypothetical protein